MWLMLSFFVFICMQPSLVLFPPVEVLLIQVSPCLGGLRVRLQHRLLPEPSQTVFLATAPTLEHFGVSGIALTRADWVRRSQ